MLNYLEIYHVDTFIYIQIDLCLKLYGNIRTDLLDAFAYAYLNIRLHTLHNN